MKLGENEVRDIITSNLPSEYARAKAVRDAARFLASNLEDLANSGRPIDEIIEEITRCVATHEGMMLPVDDDPLKMYDNVVYGNSISLEVSRLLFNRFKGDPKVVMERPRGDGKGPVFLYRDRELIVHGYLSNLEVPSRLSSDSVVVIDTLDGVERYLVEGLGYQQVRGWIIEDLESPPMFTEGFDTSYNRADLFRVRMQETISESLSCDHPVPGEYAGSGEIPTYRCSSAIHRALEDSVELFPVNADAARGTVG